MSKSPSYLVYLVATFLECSVSDPGCFFLTPDLIFSIPDPESRVKKIPDPYKRIQEILTQKPFLSSLKNDLRSSSRIRFQIFFSIPDPGVKKAPDPGSATLLECGARMSEKI